MRAAFLGPAGTNSHEALLAAGLQAEYVGFPTVAAVVAAVQQGTADRGLVPIENSREGGVGATLDALVFDAPDVLIVGELVHRVSYCLVAAEPIAPDEVRTVHSHPQGTGQCARFLAEQLPAAAVVAAPSTADAVRAVAEEGALAGLPPHAAIGTRHAAALYGASVLAEGIEDDPENATRFAWIARAAVAVAESSRPLKTVLVFWGGGDLAPGWLVACLTEFSSRSINLTRIESRPRRVGLGSYMFFCDLEGAASNPAVAAAIAGLRSHCESVRVLGSFPASG
ncbi:MAG TPA: prephenate dehydratase [Solirubrobacteraceae bacterium]|nr:prephenate dehydratase [Solirubrobacteraceae bacterium]